MIYEKQDWEDLPSEVTPVSAERLLHVEEGVYDSSVLANAVAQLVDSGRLSESAISQMMNQTINRREHGGTRYDIRDYGAKVDGILLTDARAIAGQPTVSAASSRAFTQEDVGKTIYVVGAGPVVANANDGLWLSTIVSVADGAATLATNATSSGTDLRCFFGTPDDAAYAAALEAASRADGISFGLRGGHVYFPPGRSLATLPLPVKNFVSWFGEQRDLSWVHSVQDRAGSAIQAGQCDWLTCAGRTEANPLIGVDFADFGIEAEGHIRSGGYGSAVKPLNIYYVQRCSIQNMNVWNFPATAIPFDHSYDQCSIVGNYILRPGRLAPSGVGPGGSGIGAGTKGTGATEPTLIANNVIVGSQSATVRSPGHNGIFTEAQTGASPTLGTNGYRIVNNVVIGMPYGISDTGSNGTLIEGNWLVNCGTGISLRKTTLGGSYPGLSTIITHNVVRGGTGPIATDGIGIRIAVDSAGDAVRGNLHTIISENQLIDNQSWGVSLNVSVADVSGVMIINNQVARNGRSGIRINSSNGRKILHINVSGNQVVGNGLAGLSTDRFGVFVEPGTILEGGRIQNNDIYDTVTPKSQVANVFTNGATLTNVILTGNTPEENPGGPSSLVGTPSGTNSIDLSWAAPAITTGLTDYLIEYRLPEAAGWTAFAHSASTATAATVTGLKKGHTYDFRVAAVISGAASPYSASIRGIAGLASVIDRFNRPSAPLAGTTLADGPVQQTWTQAASGTISGFGNIVAKPTAGSATFVTTPTSGAVGATQMKVHAINTPTNRRGGLVFGYSATNSYYRVSYRPTAGVTILGLQKLVGGTVTNLNSFTREAAAGDIIRVEWDADTKRIAWYVSGEFVGAVTDGDFLSGLPTGLSGDFSVDTVSSFDDFMVW